MIAAAILDNGPHDKDAQMKLRDQILMHLYYASDLNSAEISRLTIQDVDIEARCIHVHSSTGTRTVPLGPLTISHLRQYIKYFRPEIGKSCKADSALFVSVYDAEPMTPTHVRMTIKHHVKRTGRTRQPGKMY